MRTGYDFLPRVEFPHPRCEERKRTQIAGEILDNMKDTKHQIFALIVWRFHNTKEAWKELKSSLMNFDEDVEKLKNDTEKAYEKDPSPSYLFSTGDGRMGVGGGWREAVLRNLGAWWTSSKLAAEVLTDEGPTPEIWHDKVIKKIVPSLPW